MRNLPLDSTACFCQWPVQYHDAFRYGEETPGLSRTASGRPMHGEFDADEIFNAFFGGRQVHHHRLSTCTIASADEFDSTCCELIIFACQNILDPAWHLLYQACAWCWLRLDAAHITRLSAGPALSSVRTLEDLFNEPVLKAMARHRVHCWAWSL